jgi:nucleotide-binding universal stress UspA family protein
VATRTEAGGRRVQRVLVAADFGEPAADAARWVARWLAPAAELTLVHAVRVPRAPGFLADLLPPSPQLESNARRGAEQRLEELAAELGRERVRTSVRVGAPAETVVAAAVELGADLVVVGPYGRRRGLGLALGSVAEQVLRLSPVPVLVGHALRSRRPAAILVPLTASPGFGEVAGWARVVAELTSARLIALHAVDPVLHSRMRTVDNILRPGDLQARVIGATERWLTRRMEAAGAVGFEVRAVLGEPRTEIVAAVARDDVDLVVMGRPGAGFMGRSALGSVVSHIAREGASPLLLVPTPS